MKTISFSKIISLVLALIVIMSSAAVLTYAVDISSVAATYGDTLSDVELPEGYSWVNGTQGVGNVGTNNFDAIHRLAGGGSETVSVSVTVSATYISSVEISTDGSLYYTGVPVEPIVIASFKGQLLEKNRDFTVSYEDNNEIGTAKISIQGIGNFKGKTSVTFSILKIDVDGVEISDSFIELAPGKSYTLSANVTPTNATYKGITWTSSDTNVATVDNNGNVVAIADGTSEITAVSNDGGSSASCTVNVVTRVADVGITVGTVKMRYKDTYRLKVTINPWNASDTTVIWTSSDENVVTVDENGVLTSVGKGFATVTATTVDGAFVDTCEVEAFYAWWQYILWMLLGCIWYF